MRWTDSDLDRLIQLIPGYDSVATAPEGAWFDHDAARDVLDFFTTQLHFVKADKAEQLVDLEDWQVAILANLFGWKRADGKRRYRTAFILVPRKNGKTTIVAGIPLYMLVADRERGAEIYCAAADKDQATILFGIAEQMLLLNPHLKRPLSIKSATKTIKYPKQGSFFKAISALPDGKHGFDAHCVVVDELHAQRNRELVDVLETSMGARPQPMMIHITTADFEGESICNEIHDMARKIRDGVLEDDEFLPVIYETLPTDDWTDPEVWKKANPNYGVSVDESYFRKKFQKAQVQPSFRNTFKRLHLNMRTETDEAWLPAELFESCREDFDISPGRMCYAGLDLSETRDMTSFCLVFPDDLGDDDLAFTVLPYFWVPRDNAAALEKNNRANYHSWAEQGYLEMTSGNQVCYRTILEKITELSQTYEIRQVAFDGWNATATVQELEYQGLECVKYLQSTKSMSAPSKELERQLMTGRLAHGGNPILKWQFSNAVKVEDNNGDIRPCKKKSQKKIDGVIAMVMALGLCLENYSDVTSDDVGITIL